MELPDEFDERGVTFSPEEKRKLNMLLRFVRSLTPRNGHSVFPNQTSIGTTWETIPEGMSENLPDDSEPLRTV